MTINKKFVRKSWKLVKEVSNFIKTNTYTHCIYLRQTKQRFTSTKIGESYALVNMDAWFMHHDKSRYAYTLCKYLLDAGYNVVARTARQFYEQKTEFKMPLLDLNVRFVRHLSLPQNTVLLVQPDGSAKTVHLMYGFDVLKRHGFDCIAPYPVCPDVYASYASPGAMNVHRNATRGIRVLFSGDTNERKYTRKDVEATFKVISRRNVLQHIKERFSNNPSLVLINEKGLVERYGEQKKAQGLVINETKTEPTRWLQTLSRADFYICAPGVWMPWCHNLTEAMSVGTIPILQYAHLLSPKLDHLKNCLVFNNANELEKVIETALGMGEAQIANMRAEVIAYFEQNLSLNSVKGRIEKFCASDKKSVNIALPFVPRRSVSLPGSLSPNDLMFDTNETNKLAWL